MRVLATGTPLRTLSQNHIRLNMFSDTKRQFCRVSGQLHRVARLLGRAEIAIAMIGVASMLTLVCRRWAQHSAGTAPALWTVQILVNGDADEAVHLNTQGVRTVACPDALPVPNQLRCVSLAIAVHRAGVVDVPIAVTTTCTYWSYSPECSPIHQDPCDTYAEQVASLPGLTQLNMAALTRCLGETDPNVAHALTSCQGPAMPFVTTTIVWPGYFAVVCFGGVLGYALVVGLHIRRITFQYFRCRRGRSNRCRHCGYDLDKLSRMASCPECGCARPRWEGVTGLGPPAPHRRNSPRNQ
jgi:hypothetical protein